MTGVGIRLEVDTLCDESTLPRIVAVAPGSPAARCRLKEGWYVIRVNGISTRNVSTIPLLTYIRGEAGTQVKLVLADNPDGRKPKRYKLTREMMQVCEPGKDTYHH